jgi:hypothetical protein
MASRNHKKQLTYMETLKCDLITFQLRNKTSKNKGLKGGIHLTFDF